MEILSTSLFIIFIILSIFIIVLKILIYRSKQRTNEIMDRVTKKEKIYQSEREAEEAKMISKDKMQEIISEHIKFYDKHRGPVPYRIIEDLHKLLSWHIDQLSQKNETEKLNKLFDWLVSDKMHDLIKKDTEKYDLKLKKELMEKNGTNNQL